MSNFNTTDKNEPRTSSAIMRLVDIMAKLRSPEGCPWDAEQTPESLKPFIIEEAYEVIDAIDQSPPETICEELGDLLLQIVFQARIFQERGCFSLAEVADAISDKLVRRHPHVFADVQTGDIPSLNAQWDAIKAGEKKQKGITSLPFADLPRHLPALQKAGKLAQKTCEQDLPEHLGMLSEEAATALHRIADAHRSRLAREKEIGQLLFSITRICNQMGVDAEQALRKHNQQIIDSFHANISTIGHED